MAFCIDQSLEKNTDVYTKLKSWDFSGERETVCPSQPGQCEEQTQVLFLSHLSSFGT